MNESLGRKGIVNTERCECDAEREDMSHVLYSCRKYEEESEFMFRKIERKEKRILYIYILDMEKVKQRREWKILFIIFQFLKKVQI